MRSLQELASEHPDIFREAARESEETLENLEASLGVRLPDDVRWFWRHCGSGLSGAAPSAETSISDTARYREAVGLPGKYIVLEDRNDAGSVFLDTASGAVAWVDPHAISAFADGTARTSEYDTFPTFAPWVEDCIEQSSD